MVPSLLAMTSFFAMSPLHMVFSKELKILPICFQIFYFALRSIADGPFLDLKSINQSATEYVMITPKVKSLFALFQYDLESTTG